MVALAVRLSFHDCVDDKGCDGCVDLNIDDNAGKYAHKQENFPVGCEPPACQLSLLHNELV